MRLRSAVSAAAELGRSAPAAPRAAAACGRSGGAAPPARGHAPPARGPDGRRTLSAQAAATAHEAQRRGWAGAGRRAASCGRDAPAEPGAAADGVSWSWFCGPAGVAAAAELGRSAFAAPKAAERVRAFRRRGPEARGHAPAGTRPSRPAKLCRHGRPRRRTERRGGALGRHRRPGGEVWPATPRPNQALQRTAYHVAVVRPGSAVAAAAELSRSAAEGRSHDRPATSHEFALLYQTYSVWRAHDGSVLRY